MGLSGPLTEMPITKVCSLMSPTKIQLLIKPALPRLPSDMATHLPSGMGHKVNNSVSRAEATTTATTCQTWDSCPKVACLSTKKAILHGALILLAPDSLTTSDLGLSFSRYLVSSLLIFFWGYCSSLIIWLPPHYCGFCESHLCHFHQGDPFAAWQMVCLFLLKCHPIMGP